MRRFMIFLCSLFLSPLAAGCQESQTLEPGELADLQFAVTETSPVGANPHGMQKLGDRIYIAAAFSQDAKARSRNNL